MVSGFRFEGICQDVGKEYSRPPNAAALNNADPQLKSLGRRQRLILLMHGPLDLDGAGDCIHDTWKVDQHPVAHSLTTRPPHAAIFGSITCSRVDLRRAKVPASSISMRWL